MYERESVVLSVVHRCKQWVENCHGKDLEDKTPDQLNRHYRLCAKQFEPSVICKAVSDTNAICLAFVLAYLKRLTFEMDVVEQRCVLI